MAVVRDSEKEWLVALKEGSEPAFAALYNLHVKTVYAFALHILKSPMLAEDVVQEVFIKLWENKQKLDPNLPIRAYFFTLARNQSLNLIRKASKEHWITDEIALSAFDNQEDGLAFVQRKQTQVFLGQAIAELPPQRKKIYELCRVNGYSYKQAAEKLGIKDSTINSQMVKAIRFIKQYLLRNGALVLLFFLLE
jgi:RNA polymerase sigma-70 factor (family 1)